MDKDLHTGNFFISADMGWQQMERALNIHMPVKKPSAKKQLPALLPAIILSACLLLSCLHTGTDGFQYRVSSASLKHPAANAGTISAGAHPPAVVAKDVPARAGIAIVSNDRGIFLHAGFPEKLLPATGFNAPVLSAYADEYINAAGHESMIALNNRQKPSEPEQSPARPPARTAAGRFSLLAGIGMNLSYREKNQHLQPYPAIRVQYRFNSGICLAAGVSLFSPVAGQVSGISKKVFINDTASNVQYMQETTRQARLQYADIPLTLGYRISRKWSIESGVQLSVLMQKRTTRTGQYLDYQLNDVDRPYQALLQPSAVAPQEQYPVKVRPLDPRLIAALRYDLRRVSLGVSWQYALQKNGSTSNASSSRNQLVSATALFRLK